MKYSRAHFFVDKNLDASPYVLQECSNVEQGVLELKHLDAHELKQP